MLSNCQVSILQDWTVVSFSPSLVVTGKGFTNSKKSHVILKKIYPRLIGFPTWTASLDLPATNVHRHGETNGNSHFSPHLHLSTRLCHSLVTTSRDLSNRLSQLRVQFSGRWVWGHDTAHNRRIEQMQATHMFTLFFRGICLLMRRTGISRHLVQAMTTLARTTLSTPPFLLSTKPSE